MNDGMLTTCLRTLQQPSQRINSYNDIIIRCLYKGFAAYSVCACADTSKIYTYVEKWPQTMGTGTEENRIPDLHRWQPQGQGFTSVCLCVCFSAHDISKTNAAKTTKLSIFYTTIFMHKISETQWTKCIHFSQLCRVEKTRNISRHLVPAAENQTKTPNVKNYAPFRMLCSKKTQDNGLNLAKNRNFTSAMSNLGDRS